MDVNWNPWHGCKKISEGCRNCYVYRQDAHNDKDGSIVSKTANFNLPLKLNRQKSYKIPPQTLVCTCFTSDFLLDEADKWRDEVWNMIEKRQDLTFLFFTKRIDRFDVCKPANWGDGYENVVVGCTCENQKAADYRLPIFKSLPIKHKLIILAPILERIDLRNHLCEEYKEVSVGGESGTEARVCNYEWVLDIRNQCIENDITFTYHQTGAKLFYNNRLYYIRRQFQHSQAAKAGINFLSSKPYRQRI
ncbi:MAG: phage Gp37/Gp68 family protein [Bacteroidales bacterium]|jgi:protein gp37|nr:phage Gp37/Gp68 family protein [Bacteroidales bacterium]